MLLKILVLIFLHLLFFGKFGVLSGGFILVYESVTHCAAPVSQVHGSKALTRGFSEMRACGLRSMWQGNAVNVLKGTPQSTLQCLIYAQVRPSVSPSNT